MSSCGNYSRQRGEIETTTTLLVPAVRHDRNRPTWDATVPSPRLSHTEYPVASIASPSAHRASTATPPPPTTTTSGSGGSIDPNSNVRIELTMLASLVGLVALAVLVYKYIESQTETSRLTRLNREYEVEFGRLRTSAAQQREQPSSSSAAVIATLEASLQERTRALSKIEEEMDKMRDKMRALLENEKNLKRDRDQAHLDAKRALASAEAASKAEKGLALAEKEREDAFQRMEARAGELEALKEQVARAGEREA